MVNGRQKGASFERQMANYFKERGYDTHRGIQYRSGQEEADVVGLEGVHLELKRVENLNLQKAMEQSIRDCKDGEKPVVIHKKNRKPIMVTMLLDDWMEFYESYTQGGNHDRTVEES